MKRLIMTSSSGSSLTRAGLAEVGIISFFRFVGGPLPSPKELEAYFGLRSDQDPVGHWSHWSPRGRWPQEAKARRDLALIEFCDAYEMIELWFDPDPNDQLQLIWLLDHFRAYPATVAKLKLRLVGFDLMTTHETWGEWDKVPLVNVRPADIETASMCWQAYRTTVLAGFPPEMERPGDAKARWECFLQSRLTMTDFGEEVLKHELDFSQYNPVNRWWGGTELIKERLWRWDAKSRALVAP
ncbi:hypothetical protein [Bradyrhizobium sp. ORS 86]|uniref:hypothetical protein n=1 Tax=Bradyrhizobium sp. ORS 86 TaxID=1685970 RepID=UPI003890F14A